MAWWTIVSLIFTYGPKLIVALVSLIESIKKKNPDQGHEAVTATATLAAEIVTALMTRSDLTNAQKREQAWLDLVYGAKLKGYVISESNARTAAELAYQGVSGK